MNGIYINVTDRINVHPLVKSIVSQWLLLTVRHVEHSKMFSYDKKLFLYLISTYFRGHP